MQAFCHGPEPLDILVMTGNEGIGEGRSIEICTTSIYHEACIGSTRRSNVHE